MSSALLRSTVSWRETSKCYGDKFIHRHSGTHQTYACSHLPAAIREICEAYLSEYTTRPASRDVLNMLPCVISRPFHRPLAHCFLLPLMPAEVSVRIEWPYPASVALLTCFGERLAEENCFTAHPIAIKLSSRLARRIFDAVSLLPVQERIGTRSCLLVPSCIGRLGRTELDVKKAKNPTCSTWDNFTSPIPRVVRGMILRQQAHG